MKRGEKNIENWDMAVETEEKRERMKRQEAAAKTRMRKRLASFFGRVLLRLRAMVAERGCFAVPLAAWANVESCQHWVGEGS